MSDASPLIDGPRETTSMVAHEDYHPLCLDITSGGFWGRIDRFCEWCSHRLNPILIKEARQALKSRQFIWTFFALLFATWGWSVLGVVWGTPSIYYSPSGTWMLGGYYLILALPMIAIVPIAAHQSLAAELDDGTFEMLAITKLTSGGIVLGKLCSALLQMLVYFAAVVPSIAFSYLLRGIDLFTIALVLFTIFFTAILLTCFGLLLGATVVNRAARMLALLALLAVIFFAEMMCGAVCMGGLIDREIPVDGEVMIVFIVVFAIGASCMVLFLRAAMARIAPVVENRSTGLRRIMFGQQLLWIAAMLWCAIAAKEGEFILFAMMVIGGYWLLMGMLMLAESPDLSPRVQRDLPRTFLGRMLFTCFNPGPGAGYLFATASGCAGALTIGAFGTAVDDQFRRPTMPLLYAILVTGYLMFYLGLARLILLTMQRWLGRSFAGATIVMFFLLMLGIFIPACLEVLTLGSAFNTLNVLHATNCFWNLVEGIGPRRVDEGTAFVVWIAGAIVLLLNLFLLFREMAFRRIAAPIRVIEEDAPPPVPQVEMNPLA